MKKILSVSGTVMIFLGALFMASSFACREISTLKVVNSEYESWLVSANITSGTLIYVDFRPHTQVGFRNWIFDPPTDERPYSLKRVQVVVVSPENKTTAFWVDLARNPETLKVGIINITLDKNEGALIVSEPIEEVCGVANASGVYTAKIGFMFPPEPPNNPPYWIGIEKEVTSKEYPYSQLLPIGATVICSGGGIFFYAVLAPSRSKRRCRAKK